MRGRWGLDSRKKVEDKLHDWEAGARGSVRRAQGSEGSVKEDDE